MMVSYVFLCAGQRQQEIVDVSGTKVQPRSKSLKYFRFGGMYIAATSPLCSVIKKRSLGKSVS